MNSYFWFCLNIPEECFIDSTKNSWYRLTKRKEGR